MAKLKFYALVCRNMHALKRHQRTIPKEDLVIVINTRDKFFESEAMMYCLTEGIEYYITESNGTPSQGKNSVFDIFEKSDNDYMVLVDGDDFLTPHGVWTYKALANAKRPIDVVALKYQYGIQREGGYNPAVAMLKSPVERSPLLGCKDSTNPDTIHGSGTRCFLNDHEWWNLAIQGKLLEVNPADKHSVKLNDIHRRWAIQCYAYIDKWETHLRLVFFSKKAVKGNRFDPNYHIGEDTLLYLSLKHQALQGNFVMKHLFDILPTYVYDTRIAGVVAEERDKYGEPGTVDFGWYLWLKKLVEEYERYEMLGIMSPKTLPDVLVKTHNMSPQEAKVLVIDDESYYDIIWPEGYRPDTLGLVNYPNHRPIYF